MGALSASLSVLGGMLFLLAASAFLLAAKIVRPRTFSLEKSHGIEVDKGHLAPELHCSWEHREVHVASPWGYDMAADWFPLDGADRALIIVHGFTYTRYGSAKYLPLFRALGCSILAVDLRFHGATGGPDTTFGWREKEDLRAWTDWVSAETGGSCSLGSHGESMGAAIALQHAAVDPRIAFVVADCPFDDLRDLLAYKLRHDFHMPSFPLLGLAGAAAFLMTGGMRFGKVRPMDAVSRIEAPVLFIHGEADVFIPPGSSRAMHAARLALGLPSSLYIAPGADHAMSYDADPEEYGRRLTSFLEGVGSRRATG